MPVDRPIDVAVDDVAVLLSGESRITRKYRELGGEATLGQPVSTQQDVVWTFANGSSIVDNPDLFRAFEIHGVIHEKWLSLGGVAFGVPETDETGTPDGRGRFNHFTNGSASIYWTPQTGAHLVHGAIRAAWAAAGWERSAVGYPTTDETGAPDAVGRYNHFESGSIYWTPATGAHLVYGDIRARWSSLGWERSYLGYPVGDEVDFADGGRANEFEHGGIYWWPDTGAIDLRDVVVHYTGLFCFGETDWDQGSDSDEPYVIISYSSPKEAETVATQVYQDVDGGEARPDLLEVYRGRPYGLVLSSVLMEQDFGDPNKYREQVQQVVMGVHTAGTLALGLIPIVGPFVAAVAGPALGSLMPSIGGAISDLFDWGDDRLGSADIVVPAKQLVLLAARGQNSTSNGIGYKLETSLISGSGASYKAYFGVVPA